MLPGFPLVLQATPDRTDSGGGKIGGSPGGDEPVGVRSALFHSVSLNVGANPFTLNSVSVTKRVEEAVRPEPNLAMDPMSMALLAQLLPNMPTFSGDEIDGDGDSCDTWLERLVANACRWDEQARLVNVATRLRGSASRFYRSCTPQQKSSYSGITSALRKLFTPVRIQSVQSGRFHERKQLATETVDVYAQDLRKLFN